MDTPEYFVRTHPLVASQDLPYLPPELAEDFDELFKPILAKDPYFCYGQIKNHILKRKPLAGFYAMEITLDNIHYRLVYRIIESSKRVEIFSFDDHKPAYHKAADRVQTTTGQKVNK